MSLISVSHLTRNFQVFNKQPGLGASIRSIFYRPERTVKAVEDVSFEIDKGELVGFIGPNGAGKTTTLKCLSGLLYPTTGHIDVLGFAPADRKDKYLKRLDFFVENLDIANIIQVQTKKLSLGQRMKCEFVAALLHQPQVIFLDEPTIGLDVIASLKIREFIKKYNQEYKTTVILTSHNMIDVQELCHRVILIDKGQIRFDGQLSQLASQFTQEKILKFSFSENVPKKTIEITPSRFPKPNTSTLLLLFCPPFQSLT